jgi:hypothetical protein
VCSASMKKLLIVKLLPFFNSKLHKKNSILLFATFG